MQTLKDQVMVTWSSGRETLNVSHSFTDPNLFYSRMIDRRQALLKACSNKQHSIRQVLDVTAGWGIDSFILAQHGKQVTMLEQNAFIYSVLSTSLSNACRHSHTQAAAQRLTLKFGNSFDYLQRLESCPKQYACIYLDPMFPAHRSNAKPGKAMQLLQYLTRNTDIDACFSLALQKAGKRVVVKRPVKAAAISTLKPDLRYQEKTVRFDVYLT